MKFVILALLGLVSVDAIKLRQRSSEEPNGPEHPPLTGKDIVQHCDQDGDHRLTQKEAWHCVSADIPEEYRAEAKQHFDHDWKMWNFGEFADAEEIDAILRNHPEDHEHTAPAALAKLLNKRPPPPPKDGQRPPAPEGELDGEMPPPRHHDGEREAPEGEFDGPEEITGAMIIEHCDQDDNDHLTGREAWECFSEFIPEEEREEAHEMFKQHWEEANFGEDGADADELDRIMSEVDHDLDENHPERPPLEGEEGHHPPAEAEALAQMFA